MIESESENKILYKTMTSKKLYVAGKWGDRQAIHEIIKNLEKQGFIITHDWTQKEDGCNRTLQEQQECAMFDVEGVKNADVVVALFTDPQYPYRGTWTEIGIALALGKPVLAYVTSEDCIAIKNVFFYHPLIQKVSIWEDLIGLLRNPNSIEKI